MRTRGQCRPEVDVGGSGLGRDRAVALVQGWDARREEVSSRRHNFESKRRVEEHIELLGIHHTFLRPVLFMDNLSGFMTSVENGQVVVRMALPDGIPLQMVAVRDIGRAAAALLLDGGAGVEGESVEIVGNTLTGTQIAQAIGAYAGLPGRYEALPLEAIASFGDTAEMFRWLAETPAYQADFEATRALVPDALDLPAWLAASGWQLHA